MGIVERLRNLNPWSELDWPEVARGAADEIERLQRELSTARRTALLEAAGMKEALAQLNLIGHLTENMTERNWDDKRLYIMQSARRLREALRELAEEA